MQGFDAALKVGESVVLKKSAFSVGYTLVYAGMPSPGVFSVALHWKAGNQAAASNLYFPIEQTGFDLADGHVSMKHVDAQSMLFRFEK